MHVAVWEFQVPETSREAFEALYGPRGSWVELFRSDPAYLGSDLLRDESQSGRYLSVDRWQNADAYQAFKRRRADAYNALDRQGDALTSSERLLGEFGIVSA